VNGAVEADPASAPCGACHPVPGASGAHAAHHAAPPALPIARYGDLRVWADYPADGIPGYVFGCGHCHPLDPARHMNGTLDVELVSSGAPAGSLKARNASWAGYAGDGTYSGVACHSSGQATPAYRPTPAWGSGTSLGCDGCHGMPPRYASGAAGSATANTHLVARTNTYLGTVYTGAYGHFAWHNRTRALYTQWLSGQHGVTDSLTGNEVADGTFGAAPMTCQACHFETVDPAATGPSGFWWLNTTGNYLADGQNYAAFTCAAANCHDGQPGRAPPGSGGVLPRRHVNGARDVVFDPRTATTSYRAPAAPAEPTAAYWVTVSEFKDANHLPPGATFSPAPPPPDGTSAAGTLSFELTGATYDPVTKTCGSVSCHLAQSSVQWGGTGLGTMTTCFACHSVH
jgi:predicted CxxxxCH...CXXCH cytochrome family protein